MMKTIEMSILTMQVPARAAVSCLVKRMEFLFWVLAISGGSHLSGEAATMQFGTLARQIEIRKNHEI